MSATADTATNPIRLHPDQLQELADMIASRLSHPQPDDRALSETPHTPVPRLASEKEALELVDVATLARMLGVSRRFIYEHQAEMGVIKLGKGLRAPLRFDLETARTAMCCSSGRGSQGETPSVDGRFKPAPHRKPRRLPNGLPEPGKVLAIRAPGDYPAPKSTKQGRTKILSGVSYQGGKAA